MTLSRLPVAIMILVAPSTALAQAKITTEQALDEYRRRFPAPTACPTGENEEAIVICGRRGDADPHRLPIPAEGIEGERIRMVPGEAPRAGFNVGGCLRLCNQPVGVTVGIKF